MTVEIDCERIRLQAEYNAMLDELEAREVGTERLKAKIVEFGRLIQAAYDKSKTPPATDVPSS